MDAIRTGAPTPCGIEAASAHTQCTWATQQSMSIISAFPESMIQVSGPSGSRRTFVEGLDQVLGDCYDRWMLPSETGVSWGKAGREIAIQEPLSA